MSETKGRVTAARREPVAAAMTLTQAIRLSPETATILELEQARDELAGAIATLRSHEEDHGALLRHWRRIGALLYLKGAYDSEADNLSTPAYGERTRECGTRSTYAGALGFGAILREMKL